MPSRYSADLSEIGNRAIEQLTVRNRDREEGLSVSREVIRSSANAIRAVHRSDFDEARRLINSAKTRLEEGGAYPLGQPADFQRRLHERRPKGIHGGQHHPGGYLR